MTRISFAIIFSVIFLQVNAQHFKKYIRCEVKSSLFKVSLQNGGLSEWRPFGDLDSSVRSNIIFDFNKMRMIWDVRSRKPNSNIEDDEQVYEIKDLVEDTTYSDFGFLSLKFKCTGEKNKSITQYELIGFSLEDCGHLYLIENTKNYKSKQELVID